MSAALNATMIRGLTEIGRAARLHGEGRHEVVSQRSPEFASITQQATAPLPHCTPMGVRRRFEGGCKQMTFTDLYTYLRARFVREEGQTMAEYGVVLAVIALAVIVAFTALAGGISHALNNVAKILP